jgi:hypothetical protein
MTTAYNPQPTWTLEDRIRTLIAEFEWFNTEISKECVAFSDGCGERIGQLQLRKASVAAQIVAATAILLTR